MSTWMYEYMFFFFLRERKKTLQDILNIMNRYTKWNDLLGEIPITEEEHNLFLEQQEKEKTKETKDKRCTGMNRVALQTPTKEV